MLPKKSPKKYPDGLMPPGFEQNIPSKSYHIDPSDMKVPAPPIQQDPKVFPPSQESIFPSILNKDDSFFKAKPRKISDSSEPSEDISFVPRAPFQS